MKLETKYNVGDYVYRIHRQQVALPPEACSACEGTGFCDLRGEKFHCPKCGGKKTTQAQGWGWVLSDSGEVQHVEVRTRSPEDANPEDRDEWDSGEFEVRYMWARSRSGGVYEEHSLFPTRETAQAECDRRNMFTRN